ncbi:zinc ribbon-containing protein [Crenothrix polyspora]|jgi:predicted Zn-ribbon and HTH transcriptional regulator|uniref:Zinc ribbon-containing protein n=1 Tax=Crenothrix polyspora TaxID=360316 RepID=A0A1R4HDG0_9GAMM|nr:zinc ribbon-containing protein [Crenothrix polyspora]SJM94244.1 conserved hypothetical protein [Crenothrix polyspora]
MDKNKLVDAYTHLMEHLYEVMDNTLHGLADGLEVAKDKVHEASTLTREEIDKVSGFMQRDLNSAARSLSDKKDNNSLSEWLKFDIELLENFATEAFLNLADKTKLELAHLEQLAKTDNYHTGDVCAPGTLVCDDCGKEIAFKSASTIPQCPQCQGKSFIRV